MNFLQRSLFALGVLAFTFALILYGDYLTLPTHNTSDTHFDSIVVLGTPTRVDGTPSPEQRERVLEAVREYKAGVAPRLIMTGGAAHNRFIEAGTMAQLATAQGVPASVIYEEPQAQNTIENIYYSARIMHQHGWSSAEVVSSPHHLGRTELILNTFNVSQPELSIDWSTHAAHWPPEYSVGHEVTLYTLEALRCLQLRITGFPSSHFLPQQTPVH